MGVGVCCSVAMRAPQSSRVPSEPTGLARESMYCRAASYFVLKQRAGSERVVASEEPVSGGDDDDWLMVWWR